MKILFCVPNLILSSKGKGVSEFPSVSVPTGLLYNAQYLRQQGWPGDIEVFDACLGLERWHDDNGNEIFGSFEENIIKKVKQSAPNYIGISCMFSFQASQALKMADLCKVACPDAVIIIGGAHATSFPLEISENPAIDYVVMGEGEKRLYALLSSLENKKKPRIQGVVGGLDDMDLLKKHKKIKIDFIENLDEIPIPAYDLVDMNRYFELQAGDLSPRGRELGKRPIAIYTSRGCPHKCVFCSVHASTGYKWRPNSHEYLRKHIDYVVNILKVDTIHFEDDNFTHDPERFDRILDFLLELKPKIKWDTPNGVRGDSWNDERVKRTKEAGCQYLRVAIESGDQEVLTNIVKKCLDLSKIDALMSACEKYCLPLQAYFVMALPGETIANMETTIDYALRNYKKYGVTPMLQRIVPTPDTEVYDWLKNGGHIVESYNANQIETDDFSPEDVERLYKSFRRRMIPIFIYRTLCSFREFKTNIKLVIKYYSRVWSIVVNAFKPTQKNFDKKNNEC